MADLSDDDLTAIIATVTGDQSDLSGDARFEAMRAAISADRALNAAHSVGAEGLPEIDYHALIAAAFARTKAAQGTPRCVAFKAGAEWYREQALAALASRPAVDAWISVLDEMPPPDTWLLVQWGDHRAVDKAHTFTKWKHRTHKLGYLINGHPGSHNDVTHWMMLPAARHPAQRENT